MERQMAQALIEQMGREARAVPADEFDYVWWRERVEALVSQCAPAERQVIWQLALWELDALGLMPDLGHTAH